MRSTDLSRQQARALKNKIGPMLGYPNRLKKRMTLKGFPPDDELLDAVVEAEMAMHKLHVAAHYHDGNGLNNQLHNLRPATAVQNRVQPAATPQQHFRLQGRNVE